MCSWPIGLCRAWSNQASVGPVRGYRQDVLLTDNRFFLSAALRIPLWQRQRLLQLSPFVELGTGWNRGGRPNPDPNRLAAAGLGLCWQLANRLTARLD